ncbi:MAG: hypothetical protein IT497_04265 [Ottowia sp.]|nr:hypothetical protein [Ottowia sp.]
MKTYKYYFKFLFLIPSLCLSSEPPVGQSLPEPQHLPKQLNQNDTNELFQEQQRWREQQELEARQRQLAEPDI